MTRAHPSSLRLPLALTFAAMALTPAGCVRSRRQVMLILSTNIACPTIDRVTIRIARGAGSTSYTWQQQFSLTGPGCDTSASTMYPQIPLGTGGEFRLGIVDSRRTSDRVRIEVESAGIVGVRAIAETDFVDDKVYAVPMELITSCIDMNSCPSGLVCRLNGSIGAAACGSIYRSPGTLGVFPMPMSITADAYADLDEDGS